MSEGRRRTVGPVSVRAEDLAERLNYRRILEFLQIRAIQNGWFLTGGRRQFPYEYHPCWFLRRQPF